MDGDDGGIEEWNLKFFGGIISFLKKSKNMTKL